MKIMSAHFLKLFFSVAWIALTSLSTQAAPLKSVPYVDLNKYAGVWYEISHNPLFFEGGNCPCARQELSPTSQPGVLSVFNSCNKGDATGKLRTISGEAYDLDPNTNSQFSVDFHLFFRGSYWIIGLDPDYRFAVVSDKYKYSLYILSKTPTLSPELYQAALELASAQLSTSKLVMTNQNSCQYPAEKSPQIYKVE